MRLRRAVLCTAAMTFVALTAACGAKDSQVIFADPWSAPGHWYRGQLHLHTTKSDGRLAPEAALKYYHDRGYSFVSVTDHGTITQVPERPFPDFITLPGLELNFGRSEHARDFHLNGIGVKALPAHEGRTVQQVIDELRAQGAFVMLNHPYWSSLTFTDVAGLHNYHALEVQNWGSEIEAGVGYGMAWWDDGLLRGERIRAVATDDSHNYISDANGAWVVVKALELSPSAILEALKEGRYYSSEGPDIKHAAITGSTLTVTCSPARRIVLRERGGFGQVHAAENKRGLTKASFDLSGEMKRAADSGWGVARIEIIALDGTHAWSNPLWFERPVP